MNSLYLEEELSGNLDLYQETMMEFNKEEEYISWDYDQKSVNLTLESFDLFVLII